MAEEIKLKRSAVASKVPLTTDVELGELAVNTYDGKIYMKKDDGAESIVEIGAGGGGATAYLYSSTPTADPSADASVLRSVVIGDGASLSPTSLGHDSIIIGTNANATHAYHTVMIGNATGSTSVGAGQANYNVIIGDGALVDQNGVADSNSNVIIGDGANITTNTVTLNNIAIGYEAKVKTTSTGAAVDGNVAIGSIVDIGSTNNVSRNTICIGTASGTTGDSNDSVAIGPATTIKGTEVLALGKGASCTLNYGIAQGRYASSTAQDATAIGRSVTNSVAESFRVGTSSTTIMHLKDLGRLHLEGTQAAFMLPSYANGSEPTAIAGALIYDSNLGKLKNYNGTIWNDYATSSQVPTNINDFDVKEEFIHLQHKELYNVNGGTYTTSSVWQTRPFNTEVTDTGNDCTLTTNEFTLSAGTYEFDYLGDHYDGSTTIIRKCRLYNVTNAAVELEGSTHQKDSLGKISVRGRVVLSSTEILRIEHIATQSDSLGFGIRSNNAAFGDNIYADLIIRKVE